MRKLFLIVIFFMNTAWADAVIDSNLENQTWQTRDIDVTGTAGNAQGQQSMQFYPAINRLARQFSLQNISGWGGYLWYVRLQPYNNATEWKIDYDIMVDQPLNAQAIEIDGNQGTASHRVVYGTECNYKPTGTWRIWQWTGPNSKGKWIDTTIPCSLQTAQHWYHVVFTFARDPNTDNVTYKHITVTDLTTQQLIVDNNINQQFASNPKIVPNENSVNLQLDGHQNAAYRVAISQFTVIRN